jgi:beta-xylosidase
VVHELLSMTTLASEGHTVLRAHSEWQRFKPNRTIYGAVYDWHTLEGPHVVRHGGRYYCFYSGGCWETEGYGVDYAVATSVLGPYSDEGNELGPRVLRSVPGRVLGPGHNSVVVGPDGATHYVVYHAWDRAMTARRMCIDRLDFTSAGPRSPGPTYTSQPVP